MKFNDRKFIDLFVIFTESHTARKLGEYPLMWLMWSQPVTNHGNEHWDSEHNQMTTEVWAKVLHMEVFFLILQKYRGWNLCVHANIVPGIERFWENWGKCSPQCSANTLYNKPPCSHSNFRHFSVFFDTYWGNYIYQVATVTQPSLVISTCSRWGH